MPVPQSASPSVGAAVGTAVGAAVGGAVGAEVGAAVGVAVGVAVGFTVGAAVGAAVGDAVGGGVSVDGVVEDDVVPSNAITSTSSLACACRTPGIALSPVYARMLCVPAFNSVYGTSTSITLDLESIA